MKYRVLLADDEPLAREGLRDLISVNEECAVVGECRDGAEAIERIRELSPDLVFLDIQMPHLSGFEVVEQIGIDQMPMTVFVTAYDTYALRAFDLAAADYVLKPIDERRFATALNRAVTRLRVARTDSHRPVLERALQSAGHPVQPLRRIAVRTDETIRFVPVDDIFWMSAADNYVEVHSRMGTHLVRDTLSAMETKLDREFFVRIRRSAIVNLRHVTEVRHAGHGKYELRLGERIAVRSSRRYRQALASLIDC